MSSDEHQKDTGKHDESAPREHPQDESPWKGFLPEPNGTRLSHKSGEGSGGH